MYNYRLLDPRPQARAAELEWLRSHPALGIEVTIPDLAAACSLGNIDPQHAGQDVTTAACEAAMDWPYARRGGTGSWLVTIRPDADAFTAMAVFEMQSTEEWDNYYYRPVVRAVGADDRTAGEWTPGQPVEDVTDLQVLKAICMDNDLSLEDRVGLTRAYLLVAALGGTSRANPTSVRNALYHYAGEPDWPAAHAKYTAKVVADRREYAVAADEVTTTHGGRIAVIESDSRYGVQAAYLKADVVVAVNPLHRWPNGDVTRKATICQRRPGFVDLAAVFADLGDGWGGSPVVGGSPQGVDCTTPLEDIVNVVARHLALS